MAYGIAESKERAEELATTLRVNHPENCYLASPHEWYPNNTPKKWGVVRYIPYCEQMPWRCDGFVWFA